MQHVLPQRSARLAMHTVQSTKRLPQDIVIQDIIVPLGIAPVVVMPRPAHNPFTPCLAYNSLAVVLNDSLRCLQRDLHQVLGEKHNIVRHARQRALLGAQLLR